MLTIGWPYADAPFLTTVRNADCRPRLSPPASSPAFNSSFGRTRLVRAGVQVHQKLVSLTMPVLTAEFAKMKADKGLMFKSFQKDYPTGYQPDPVKLQEYYSDIAQLVLLNPKFA